MSEPSPPFVEHTAYASLWLAAGVRIVWSETIELAVDDPLSRRVDRTVTLGRRRAGGVSRRTGEPFPGAVVRFLDAWERVQDPDGALDQVVTATYVCAVPYRDFVDARDGVDSSPEIAWGRIRFSLACPSCEARTDDATQNNAAVPREIRCSCGALLAVERASQPLFARLDGSSGPPAGGPSPSGS